MNFQTPRGLRLSLSALASPNFATSYQLGSVGVVDGSISYLFASVPLNLLITPQSETVHLPELLRSYRPINQPQRIAPEETKIQAGENPWLLYGRMYLPQSLLEALAVRRISPELQVQFSAVSAQHLRNGGTAVAMAQYDAGKYAGEGLVSTDGGLLGLRGIYNFGDEDGASLPIVPETAASSNGSGGNGNGNSDRERIFGRFSAGGEIYYGTLNKSGGMSIGTRFATLPTHRGTPLAATLTLNPLMGNIAASYAVVAGRHCSLATRMEFNIFSYESAWAVGMELWRKPFARPPSDAVVTGFPERSFQAKLEWRLDEPKPLPEVASKDDGLSVADKAAAEGDKPEEYAGVLKARLDQNLRIGLLWEGRVKSLLFSLGSGIDLRQVDKPFRTLGLEIQFSS